MSSTDVDVMPRIVTIRGYRVLLDQDLAELYGVPTKTLNQAVKRNAARFPSDFMFQLTPSEASVLRSQIGTSKPATGSGGRRTPPYAFTEQGVAMLSGVLRSPEAILVNVEIMRAFVQIRRTLTLNADLASRLEELQGQVDEHHEAIEEHAEILREVLAALKGLLANQPKTPPAPLRKIGFDP